MTSGEVDDGFGTGLRCCWAARCDDGSHVDRVDERDDGCSWADRAFGTWSWNDQTFDVEACRRAATTVATMVVK